MILLLAYKGFKADILNGVNKLIYNKGVMIMKYKQKVKANVDVIMTVWINEDVNGNKEIEDIEDVEEIREINDWEEN